MPHRPALAALTLLFGLAACGGETKETTSARPPQPPDQPLVFVDGFEKAAALAEAPDDLLFVYVGRHSPT